MILKRKAGLVLIVVFTMIVNFTVYAFDQDMTRHIEETDQDIFVLDTGVAIDANFMTVLSPDMDIRGMLFFEDIKINHYHFLYNATLRLRTFHGRSFEADSSITIYGVRDYGGFGYSEKGSGAPGSPSAILNLPLTNAFVNYNTSQFYGASWKEIDVTVLVKEMQSDRHYDGPGSDPSDRGDNMIFMIYGIEGFEPRSFYDFKAGNNLEAQLVIHWTDSPQTPPGYDFAIFNRSYRNYTIWEVLAGQGYPLDPMEYIFTNYTSDPYYVAFDNSTGFGPSFVGSTDDVYISTYPNSARKVVRTGNGTLYAVYHIVTGIAHQVKVSKSVDNGATWIDETNVGDSWNDAGLQSGEPSMAIDSQNNLHVVWHNDIATELIYYSKYNGASWSPQLLISTGLAGMSATYHYNPSIAVGSNDYLYVFWAGHSTAYPPPNSQIWLRIFNTSAWNTPTRVSTFSGMDSAPQRNPAVAIDSNDFLHVVWTGEADGFVVQKQIWYNRYTTGWAGPLRINTAPGMEGLVQSSTSISVDSLDNVHVAGAGMATAYPADFQVYYIRGDSPQGGGDWTTPLRLSTEAGSDNFDDRNPSIATDTGDNLTVIWNAEAGNMWSTFHNGTAWSDPSVIQSGLGNPPKLQAPSLRWARWPVDGDSTYLVTDANGTVIVDGLENYEDALIYIDDLLGVDPAEPDPAGQGWDPSGPFSRFSTRLYILLIGVFLVFGPLMTFALNRPSGYEFTIGVFIMVVGFALMYAAGQV